MATYEVNCSNVNSCDMMPNAPGMTLRDKVQILHELISNASGLAFGIREFLFGIGPSQDNSLEPSTTCMDDELKIMIDQMKKVLDHLSEIRNQLG